MTSSPFVSSIVTLVWADTEVNKEEIESISIKTRGEKFESISKNGGISTKQKNHKENKHSLIEMLEEEEEREKIVRGRHQAWPAKALLENDRAVGFIP